MTHNLEKIYTLKKTCHDFFSDQGYYCHTPANLIPEADRSVLYTNSAIIPFKNMIFENNIPLNAHYLLQECIRLHETKLTPNEMYFLQRMSCFSMFGIFAPINLLNQICRDMVCLLLDILQVDKERLVFHAASDDRVFWNILESLDVQILWDNTPPDDYQWEYGIPNVIGRGLNIGILPQGAPPESIKQVDDIDIGQIIVIKNNGYFTCFEVALGVEAFLWRNSKEMSPFAVAEIAAFMPFKFEPLHLQLMDAIVLGVIFYGNNIDLYAGNSLKIARGKSRYSTVKKAVKNIAEIESLLRPSFDISKIIIGYANFRGFRPERIARLLEAIEHERSIFSQKERRLFEYSKTCARSIKNDTLTYAEACQKVSDKAQKKYALYPSNIELALMHLKRLVENP